MNILLQRPMRPRAGATSNGRAGSRLSHFAQVDAGRRRWVLRRKPPGALLPSAHAVEREYRVLAALSSTGFPVPRPYALCEDAELLGTPFYVMEHVEGRVLWEPSLPDLSPRERFA